MRVAIIQPNFLPWRGYFDMIDDADMFIIHDDLQYTKQDWRNRNLVKTPQGLRWITVPVRHVSSTQLICSVEIAHSTSWRNSLQNRFRDNYRRSPYYQPFAELLDEEIREAPRLLADLDVKLIERVCSALAISTPMVRSSTLSCGGKGSGKVIELLLKVGASTYLSGPAGRAYLDVRAFNRSGLALEYKSYDYQAYPQPWGPFSGGVCILDLLMNTGPEARAFLKSSTPNQRVISV